MSHPRSSSPSSARLNSSNNSFSLSSKDERETAFWLTVEQIALGLKHDVERTQDSPLTSNGHTRTNSHGGTASATDGSPTSVASSTNSVASSVASTFTLTAHISSTLHQLIHLHYESLELEGRIEACRDTMTKQTNQVEQKQKSLKEFIQMQEKQIRQQQLSSSSQSQSQSRSKGKSPSKPPQQSFTPDEIRLIQQVKQLLSNDEPISSATTRTSPSPSPTKSSVVRPNSSTDSVPRSSPSSSSSSSSAASRSLFHRPNAVRPRNNNSASSAISTSKSHATAPTTATSTSKQTNSKSPRRLSIEVR